MKTWVYVEPGEDGITPVTVTVTEAEILRTYYPWWSGQMEKVGKSAFISEAACIEDWVVVHWAFPVAGASPEGGDQ